MTDKVEYVGTSIIHHGKENDRVYLMKLAGCEQKNILSYMEKLAFENGYSKIVAKVPVGLKSLFLDNGFTDEAYVENFFKGKEGCCFLSKYLTQERKELNNKDEILKIVQLSCKKAGISSLPALESGFSLKPLSKEHIPQMTQIYTEVFESYPFPIFDRQYILKTMSENVDYCGMFYKEKLIALSSCEMDIENLNAEMTDFATLQPFRGMGLSCYLLVQMEKTAKEKGIKTAYTISRSKSAAMNMVFAKNLYKFGGMLINNTNICGNLETMNVWYKSIC